MIGVALAFIAATGTPAGVPVGYQVLEGFSGKGEEVRVLLVKSWAPQLERLSAAERTEWERALREARQAWGGADQRQRAALALRLSKAVPSSHAVSFREVDVLLASRHLVRCRNLVFGGSSFAVWSCSDRETGGYWMVRLAGKGIDIDVDSFWSQPPEDAEATLQRIRRALERSRLVAWVDVAGREVLVPSIPPEPAAVGAELASLWQEIPDPGARQRLALVAALLDQLRDERFVPPGKPEGWPSMPSLGSALALPFPVTGVPGVGGLLKFKLHMTHESSLPLGLDSPSQSLTEPWLGEGGWREPDLSGSPKLLLKRHFPP